MKIEDWRQGKRNW